VYKVILFVRRDFQEFESLTNAFVGVYIAILNCVGSKRHRFKKWSRDSATCFLMSTA